MKKEYTAPEIAISKFAAENVVTLSAVGYAYEQILTEGGGLTIDNNAEVTTANLLKFKF